MTVREALAIKYSTPYHVLLWEVRNSTGFDSSRSADAIAISLYVSRGQSLTGFEIKDSRGDWLAELKHPEKAEEIGRFCDYFFLVTSSDSVARKEELPAPWGWLSLSDSGKRLRVLKQAEKLKSVPLDRSLLCSIVYATMKHFQHLGQQSLELLVAERVNEEHGFIKSQADSSERNYRALLETIREFENVSGLDVRYNRDMPNLGKAVRRIMRGDTGITEYRNELKWLTERIHRMQQNLERELRELDEQNKNGGRDAGAQAEAVRTSVGTVAVETGRSGPASGNT